MGKAKQASARSGANTSGTTARPARTASSKSSDASIKAITLRESDLDILDAIETTHELGGLMILPGDIVKLDGEACAVYARSEGGVELRTAKATYVLEDK